MSVIFKRCPSIPQYVVCLSTAQRQIATKNEGALIFQLKPTTDRVLRSKGMSVVSTPYPKTGPHSTCSLLMARSVAMTRSSQRSRWATDHMYSLSALSEIPRSHSIEKLDHKIYILAKVTCHNYEKGQFGILLNIEFLAWVDSPFCVEYSGESFKGKYWSQAELWQFLCIQVHCFNFQKTSSYVS